MIPSTMQTCWDFSYFKENPLLISQVLFSAPFYPKTTKCYVPSLLPIPFPYSVLSYSSEAFQPRNSSCQGRIAALVLNPKFQLTQLFTSYKSIRQWLCARHGAGCTAVNKTDHKKNPYSYRVCILVWGGGQTINKKGTKKWVFMDKIIQYLESKYFKVIRPMGRTNNEKR